MEVGIQSALTSALSGTRSKDEDEQQSGMMPPGGMAPPPMAGFSPNAVEVSLSEDAMSFLEGGMKPLSEEQTQKLDELNDQMSKILEEMAGGEPTDEQVEQIMALQEEIQGVLGSQGPQGGPPGAGPIENLSDEDKKALAKLTAQIGSIMQESKGQPDAAGQEKLADLQQQVGSILESAMES